MRLFVTLLALCLPAPALALDQITAKSDFLRLVQGKELQIRLYGVALRVSARGQITGRGGGKPVRGDWTWKNGGFCRSMTWGDEPLPYTCQTVHSDGRYMRFTSDMGQGDAATFALR